MQKKKKNSFSLYEGYYSWAYPYNVIVIVFIFIFNVFHPFLQCLLRSASSDNIFSIFSGTCRLAHHIIPSMPMTTNTVSRPSQNGSWSIRSVNGLYVMCNIFFSHWSPKCTKVHTSAVRRLNVHRTRMFRINLLLFL